MLREIERWITLGGRRIPIFKKDGILYGIKPINKKELVKKIYKDGQGNYTLDLPRGYRTIYGTDYIQYKDKSSVKYDLENNVTTISANPEYQKTIKGFKKPEGNPELTAFGRYKGQFVRYTYDDYPSKTAFERDLKSNEIKNIHISDKRDKYISDHTNYGNMSQIYNDYKIAKKRYEYAKNNGHNTTADLFKGDADKLKEVIDKANKIYLQKQKRYKMKK